jgi:putative aldouronate transport system permease protein
MSLNETRGYKVFYYFNLAFLLLTAFLCLAPLIHILAISLSDSVAAATGQVAFLPVGFTFSSYEYALEKKEFLRSFFIAIERAVLAVVISMTLTILCAYPLSKNKNEFPHRNLYAWFLFIPMVFSGGLIPWFMTIKATGLIDKIWALVIPSAVPVFHVIILQNFFRQLPKEIAESAFIDGASEWQILWKIYLPLSKPVLATLTLFVIVWHWNSWFDGMILLNNTANYPLQTFLQTVIVKNDNSLSYILTTEELKKMAEVSDRTNKAAQIFIGAIPVLCLYPFLQRYFVTGLTLGSVKG